MSIGAEVLASPSRAPKPSKTPVSKAGAIVYATVEGRSGKYAVVAGDPLTYRPTGVKFSGVTTMYGNDDNGTGTSSGRRFDENEFTCAHKTLPFGTRLAVTKGGRSVIVTVTDRGPFTPGRMLDLTTALRPLSGRRWRRDREVRDRPAGSLNGAESPRVRRSLTAAPSAIAESPIISRRFACRSRRESGTLVQ